MPASLELPVLVEPQPTAIARERYERFARRARLLSWLSLAWMTVEGAVAIAAGIVAGSIALVGFGLDSAIEGFASVIIIWRFTGHRVFSHAAEERAQKLVSHHARQLKTAGLARSERDGKMVMYELTAGGLALLAAIVPEQACA